MRTVLFGLDGATFTVLDHLLGEGVMPNLAEFCRRGVRSLLRSTPLPITPQAWTSMATGRGMGAHGFHDFVRVEFGPRGPLLRFNGTADRRCEYLWKYASRQGKRVTILNYIGLAPPEPVEGHTMPGFVPGRHLKRTCFPADLFSRLAAIGDLDVGVLGLELDTEKQSLAQLPADQWLGYIDHHIERERAWFAIMEYLMVHEPSDLTAIVFDGVDKLQHLAYRFLDPRYLPQSPSPWERQVIDRCRAYFRQIDKFLGRVLEILGDEGRVFIASDHGFTATTEVVYINKWLHDQGLLHWKVEVPEDQAESIVVDRLTRFLDVYDWEKTRAFALTPSSNGIYIINVPPREYEAFRNELIDKLRALRGSDGGRIVVDIKKREDWFPGPFMNRAADLTLTVRDHGFLSVLNASAPVIARKTPAGTHHPDGVLIGRGPGLKRNEVVARRDILDVAPLLAHSLGLAIPAEYEGEFPAELYEEAYLASDPPRVARESSHPAVATGTGEGESALNLDESDEAVLLDRLRSLGYIE
jgi:predicted AlkP superfamily phosphohydrolase/phosphomutase